MTKLVDLMLKDGTRERIIVDLERLIDQEVADRRGVSGLAIKGGYKVVKKFKAGFINDALTSMFPEFVEALDPFYQEHGSAEGFDAFMMRNKSKVADGLLGVTDARRDSTSNKTIKKVYNKLRPMAKSNVESSFPRLSKLMQKHITELA